ncbi:MAG: rRNA maturation RNase YbeY [Caldilineales bacterium]|nr:rRNA maturation RNase YbeY [Caldilineales bacterium]MDW8318754.1 rRNA maturation RNase YbeY [Anaerolineae bacterium]
MSHPPEPLSAAGDGAEPDLITLVEGPIEVQAQSALVDRVPARRLAEAAEAALRCGRAAHGQLCLVVADDEALRELNLAYRGVDAATDVLSFAAQEEAPDAAGPFVAAEEAADYLGDVVISLPTAERQAAAAGHTVEDELCLLAVHGALHLLGYDHGTPEEEEAMWAVQAEALAQVGVRLEVPRHLSAA